MAKMKPTFLDLAIMALEAAGRPLTPIEMIRWGQRTGRLQSAGKTPDKTMFTALTRSIMDDPHTPFTKTGSAFRMRIGGGGPKGAKRSGLSS